MLERREMLVKGKELLERKLNDGDHMRVPGETSFWPVSGFPNVGSLHIPRQFGLEIILLEHIYHTLLRREG